MLGLLRTLKEPQGRDLACVAGGMGLLLAGGKLSGLALFGKGIYGLEQRWREKRGFTGTWSERLERSAAFYEGTHQDPTNRALHRAGIPMVLGGAVGLLLFPAYRPAWAASWGLFTVGWGLNLVGHAVYEKNSPAFAEDPLSFVMGPLWDLKQMRGEPAAPAPMPRVAEPEPELAGASA
ncbi:MAG: DUF962 domain-containing protein [Planctomycetota bacterium]